MVFASGNFIPAARFLGPTYIQHRADAEDGVDGLRTFMLRMRERYPRLHAEIKRVFTDGDFVILQVHDVPEPGGRGSVTAYASNVTIWYWN